MENTEKEERCNIAQASRKASYKQREPPGQGGSRVRKGVVNRHIKGKGERGKGEKGAPTSGIGSELQA